uniref:Nuclear receptor domain-containing protein n=1 Tax=Panagrellus redivivus TaxID=6233 RepID=A0A7E4W4Y8_PANRE
MTDPFRSQPTIITSSSSTAAFLFLSVSSAIARKATVFMLMVQPPVASSSSVSPATTETEDAPTNNNSSERSCLVCGQISHGYHFGILACRACAAFFRRTVAEKKVYRCRNSCNCQISKEMRNMCRCCRFKRCIELGMNKEDVQLNRDPLGKRKEDSNEGVTTVICCNSENSRCGMEPKAKRASLTPKPLAPVQVLEETLPQVLPASMTATPTTIIYQAALSQQAAQQYSLAQPIGILPCSMAPSQSVMQQLMEGYNNYNSSQKSLFTVMYPDNIFAAEVFKQATHTEFVKMERGCLSLQFSMLNDSFHPFSELSQDQKINVLQLFSRRFTILDSMWRSAAAFPLDDNKVVMHYGQYLDINNLEHFFKDDKDPKESAHLFTEAAKNMTLVKSKILKLKLTVQEYAALLGVMLWNEVGMFVPQFTAAEDVKNRIYSELHTYLISMYGITGTGARMGSILFLLQDINVIAKDITEQVIIGKLFNPHLIEVWDDL